MMALKRANLMFSVAPLRGLAEAEFEKITAEVWARYEDHAIKVENNYRAVDEVCTDVEAAFNGDRDDDEVEGGDLDGASDAEEDAMSEKARRSITGAQMWKRGPWFSSCVDWGLCWVDSGHCDLLDHTASDASVSQSKR